MKHINNSVSTEDTVEVFITEHRGFAIKEFVIVSKVFEADDDYYREEYYGDGYYGPIPGVYKLQVRHMFRAVRIKNNSDEWCIRAYSVEEAKRCVDASIDDKIPF